MKINPKNSIVVNVVRVDELGNVINSTSPFEPSWFLFEVVDSVRKRRSLNQLSDLISVDELESHAGTGWYQSVSATVCDAFILL